MRVCSPSTDEGEVLLEKTRAIEFSDRLKQVEEKLDCLHTEYKQDTVIFKSERGTPPTVRLRSVT